MNVCYICGNQAKTTDVLCKQEDRKKSEAYFPFLTGVTGAPGSLPINSACNTCQLCNLCFQLLHEQWKCYEKRNIPQTSRQYWIKGFYPLECQPQPQSNFSLGSAIQNCTDNSTQSPSKSVSCISCKKQFSNKNTKNEQNLCSGCMAKSKNNVDVDMRLQLASLYENLIMQFQMSGSVDGEMLSQMQQLCAAETLASLQTAPQRSSTSTEMK